MGRLKTLRDYVDGELETLTPEKRSGAVAHLYGVSLAATMIAQKRGLDAELLSMAAMLHDLYAYKSGSYDDHAHKGADVIHHCMNDLSKPVKDKERARFDSLCAEFGMARV